MIFNCICSEKQFVLVLFFHQHCTLITHRLLIFLFIFCFTISSSFHLSVIGNALCSTNEEYRDCGSTCQEKSCDLKDVDVECPTVCDPAGCYCIEGYIRNDDGDCVHPTECPTTEAPRQTTGTKLKPSHVKLVF